MPRWRTMIAPAWTAWPSPALIPSRWPTLSRPFLTLPPAFLCAIWAYSLFFARGALAVPVDLALGAAFADPLSVVSAFAALVVVFVLAFADGFSAFAGVLLDF